MNDVLELEIRRKIFNLIAKNPGLHARKIAEILAIQGQLTDYHLAYLEREELIVTVKEEGYRRCYVKGKLGVTERARIAILRKETPLRIVLFLLQHPYSLHKDILESVGVVKSTLSYHLDKLVKHQIIKVQAEGSEKRYALVNEKELYDLLIRYKPYSRIESFKDTWVDLEWPGAKKSDSEEK
jgi:predicted transcriptional regulator